MIALVVVHKIDGQLKGVLSWHTLKLSQCARVVRISVS